MTLPLSFTPKVIGSFFSNEEYIEVSSYIDDYIEQNIIKNKNKYSGLIVSKEMGCFIYRDLTNNMLFSDKIKNNIINKIYEYTGLKTKNILLDINRYSLDTGQYPRLFAHRDNPDNMHLMSFSLPLNNKETWDMYIENKCFSLNNNDALFFCVTDKVHWRPAKIFKNNENFDMLVVRFYIDDGFIDSQPIEKNKLKDKIEHKYNSKLYQQYEDLGINTKDFSF